MKKYINIDDMVNVNCSNVLDIIQKNEPVSRKEITQLSGLSWGGMTKIVNKLLENGYITEKKAKSASASGRIPSVLRVNTEKNFVIGLDINKTGLNATVMDLTGKSLKSFSANVSAKTREGFIAEITAFVSEIFAVFGTNNIISIGVAMQGTVDCNQGISVRFPDIKDWSNVPIREILENRFNVKAFIEHDPDCLLYPHLDYRKAENTILLRIDKSIGMAVAIGGKVLKGIGILEIAHNTIVPNGKKCTCGATGCLEAYVYPCIEKGRINSEAINDLITPLCITIKNMTNIFNADRVILTGALMEYCNEFSGQITSCLKNLKCTAYVEFTNISDYAIRGAALIAINKTITSLII
ncbi:MAG: ROK family transcriptional regulator [Eubacteriales bacterium]|nr:ROK family transcriptional regulator [Eubacteriales bacterium]